MDDRPTDEEILTELADALKARREVPGDIVEDGVAIFSLRTLDAELARLTYDSSREASDDLAPNDAGLLVVTRSEVASLRSLAYSAPDLGIELEVTSTGVMGQLVPPQAATVTVQAADGSAHDVPADSLGWFAIRPAPRARFRLTCCTAAGRCVTTSWITL